MPKLPRFIVRRIRNRNPRTAREFHRLHQRIIAALFSLTLLVAVGGLAAGLNSANSGAGNLKAAFIVASTQEEYEICRSDSGNQCVFKQQTTTTNTTTTAQTQSERTEKIETQSLEASAANDRTATSVPLDANQANQGCGTDEQFDYVLMGCVSKQKSALADVVSEDDKYRKCMKELEDSTECRQRMSALPSIKAENVSAEKTPESLYKECMTSHEQDPKSCDRVKAISELTDPTAKYKLCVDSGGSESDCSKTYPKADKTKAAASGSSTNANKSGSTTSAQNKPAVLDPSGLYAIPSNHDRKKAAAKPCGLVDNIPFINKPLSGVDIRTPYLDISLGGCDKEEAPVLDGPGAMDGLDYFKRDYRGNKYGSAMGILSGWTNFALPFVSIIAIIAIIYAGFLYLTAFGNEEQTGKAKKIIIWVVIGIVLIFSAYALVNTLLSGTAG